jgi:hypothetical protein
MSQLLNAEGLPIEGIDKLELTLNENLHNFIDFKMMNVINSQKYIKIRYSNYFGWHWYLIIQSQRINLFDVRMSIAEIVSELINKKFIDFPNDVALQFIYINLNWFISEVREIEFNFDFYPEAIREVSPDILKYYKGSIYSPDWRKYENKANRRSNIIIYYRNPRLLDVNQLKHGLINQNRYSRRIEFRLCKNNCPYRALNNLIGNYSQIITNYSSFLSTLFYRHFKDNIIIDTFEHPHFANIYTDAIIFKRERYTGSLEKMKLHTSSESELKFYSYMNCARIFNIFRC